MTAAQAAGSALGKRSWKARKATTPPDFFKKLRAIGVEKQKKKKADAMVCSVWMAIGVEKQKKKKAATDGYTEDVV